MLPELKYRYINWADGMKLTGSHFVAEENAITEKIHDTGAVNLTSFNYGLLLPAPGKHTSLSVNIDVDRATLLRVKVNECRAITPGGARIDITNSSDFAKQKASKELLAEYNLSSTSHGKILYIVISVNPYLRQPVGEPDPDENPPRYPFSDFQYNINIVPAEEINLTANGLYHITIGKVRVVGNGVEIIEKYIPPCSKVKSHEELVVVYDELDKMLSMVESNATTIVQKIYRKEQEKNSVLAKSVLYLSENVVRFLGGSMHHFRWFVPEMPPMYMVEYFASFARTIKNSIDMRAGTGKEEMLNYFKDWVVEVNQGEFEAILDEMVNVEYNHMDINHAIEKIEDFSMVVSTVFNKVSKLDYVGDKKRTDFIVTSSEAEVSKPNKKRTFLLDSK